MRDRFRAFIEELIRRELDTAWLAPATGVRRMPSGPASIVGHRHGSRTRALTGSLGKTEVTVPRARL